LRIERAIIVNVAATDPRIAMAAWRAFLEAHAHITELLEQELQAEHHLSLPWYDVLVQLNEVPDRRLRMTELAAAVLLSKSGLTRLVDRMLSAGLVDREADPGDRRGIYVCLTDAGLQRLREAAPTHLRGIQEHFGSRLSIDEASTIADALGRLAWH
jgi:DNA-binding MarR family transcriptional regulator